MTRDDVQRWLDRYVAAWRSYDRDAIGALFAEDAVYRYHPYDEPLTGRDAIVESWLEDPDEPGSFEARYEPYAVEGDRAVAVGTSTYASGDVYENVFLLRFDAGGRCAELTEWFMQRPKG
jgi:ketosteroid isomerase-like protein